MCARKRHHDRMTRLTKTKGRDKKTCIEEQLSAIRVLYNASNGTS